MNALFDGLPEEVLIRIAAVTAAAEAAQDSQGISFVLRNAKMIETYIRTGSTNGR